MSAEQLEEWRPVAGFEGYYEVSDLGRVRNIKKARGRRVGHILHQHLLSNGLYFKVDLHTPGQRVSRPVHRLVGEAFYGPLPDGLQTRHLNGDGFDNRLVNLRYGTHLENMRDSVEHGTHVSLRTKARTECSKGHEYTEENTWRAASGSRVCRRCSIDNTLAAQRRNQARREAAGEVTPHVIREWAAPIFGIDPTLTGRIHNDVKWAYAYAHPGKGWTPTPDPRRKLYVPPTPADLIAAYPHLAGVIETRELRAS